MLITSWLNEEKQVSNLTEFEKKLTVKEIERLQAAAKWQREGDNRWFDGFSRDYTEELIALGCLERSPSYEINSQPPNRNYYFFERITPRGLAWIDGLKPIKGTTKDIELSARLTSDIKYFADWQREESHTDKRWLLEKDIGESLCLRLQEIGYVKRRNVYRNIVEQMGGAIFRFTKKGLAWADTLKLNPKDDK